MARARSTVSRAVCGIYVVITTCRPVMWPDDAKGVILETELRHDAGFRNYYEESKHLAELEVEALKS